MIDMSSLYNHINYQTALNNFNASSCKWSLFQDVHIEVSKGRCPICECKLDGSVSRLSNRGTTITIQPTIDHYRPKRYYGFLECEHKNYLLMCSDCNNIYKGSEFPLHHSTPTRAIDKSNLVNEKPLIVNPIYDNLLELFILVFRRTTSGKEILELKPKATTGYLYEKALETIRLFGLGDCEVNRHSNDNIYNCRISILESHFGRFLAFVKALQDGDKTKALLELRLHKEDFETYGFYEFIKRKQFVVLV